jgi:REP element-mobilizing transposase RayT
MGRDLRIIDPDSIYHVVSCGSNRGPIAWDEHDFESLSRDFAAAAVLYAWEVFAWCAMTTHHHVVVRAPAKGFSPGFQMLNGNHARRTNRRHGREAHLFKNRPFAAEVDSAPIWSRRSCTSSGTPSRRASVSTRRTGRTAATAQQLG